MKNRGTIATVWAISVIPVIILILVYGKLPDIVPTNFGFDGAVNVLDYVMEDYMVLANYVQAFEGGVVEASNSPLAEKYEGLLLDYSTVDGSGRIVMEAASRDTEETVPATQTPDTSGATVQETVVQTPVEAEPSSSTPILIIALASCAALAALAYLFQKKEH